MIMISEWEGMVQGRAPKTPEPIEAKPEEDVEPEVLDDQAGVLQF